MQTGAEEIPDGTRSFPEAMDISRAVHVMKMPTHLKPIWRAGFLHEMASAQKTEAVQKNRPLLNR
jgi:hypothetical protein